MTAEHRRPALLTRLLGPADPELSCEECFELLDEYVELELAGADADRRIPRMREHLQGCPACHEDHESVRDFVRLANAGPDQGVRGRVHGSS
jgi:tRNA-dihydrouridine synthase